MKKVNFKHLLAMGKIKAKNAAPHVMLVVGVGGIIYTIVKTAMKARTMDDELEDELSEVADIEDEIKHADENGEDEEFDLKEAKKRLRKAKFKVVRKGAKLFLVPILVGVASLTLIITSHAIMANELAIVSTTLAAVESKFRDYREGVRERDGEEADAEIMYGRHSESKTIQKPDPDTGELKNVVVNVSDWREGHSVYAMAFCRTYCGSMFADNQYYDEQTIRNMLTTLKNDFEESGVAKLSRAYDYLHHDITREALKAGWVKDNPNGGDNYIRVDVFPTVFEFTPGQYENGYILDFNVDGNIEYVLPKPRRKGFPRLIPNHDKDTDM